MERNPQQDDLKPKRLGRGTLLSLLQKQHAQRNLPDYMARPGVASVFHHPEPDFSHLQDEARQAPPLQQDPPKQTSHSPAEAKETSHSQQQAKQASNFQTVAGLAGRGRTMKVEEALQRMEISEGGQARRTLVEPSGFRQPSVSPFPRQKMPPCLANHRGSPSARALYSMTVNPDPPRKLPPGFRPQTATTLDLRNQGFATSGGTTPLALLRKSPPAVKTTPQSQQIPPSSNQSASSVSKSSGQKSQPGPPIVMKGSSGNPANVTCNYVKINWEPDKGVFVYDVKFNPDVESMKFRRDLIRQFESVVGLTRTFDGLQLQLPFKLPQQETVLIGKLPSDSSEVEVTIRFKKETQLSDRIHLLNALLRRVMNILGLHLIGQNFFDPASAKPIPTHRLEVWPGYVTSIDEFEGGVYLCCDASHRVLRTQTMLELMQDLQSSLGADGINHFTELALGKSVLTRYNNRVYRVEDVDFTKTPLDTFSSSNGDISFVDYYRKSYGLEITNLKQPLIVSKRKFKFKQPSVNDKVLLIPEFCYITGLSDEMRADMKVMKDVASFTRILPFERVLTLRKFIKNINSNPDASKILSSWGVHIEDATLGLPGRILVPETIHFGDSEVPGSLQADWSRATANSHVLSVVDLEDWIVVYPRREEKVVKDFIQMCLKCGQPMGVQVNSPAFYPLNSDALDQYISQVKRAMTPKVQLVMCVLSAPRADKYSAIKKLCCLEIPVASQVMLIRTIRRYDRIRAVAQKVLLQVNCKLGGTLWAVRIPVKNAMICGIDTYHDTHQGSKSVVALVSSLNPSFTRWYSSVSFQDVGHELGDDMLANFTTAIIKNSEVCGSLPDPIIIFRDGVGDGELMQCREVEFSALFEACQIIDADYKPKILFVVVQKRIHTRLFLDKDSGVDNPPPGTIVDHTITRRNWYDFFLVSQCVRQGTVNPTHYVVVQNSTNMLPDHVQRLSYKLTHLYYNWAGTVRVPAPCQYAHKLAFLIGDCIHREVNELLRDKLYYL